MRSVKTFTTLATSTFALLFSVSLVFGDVVWTANIASSPDPAVVCYGSSTDFWLEDEQFDITGLPDHECWTHGDQTTEYRWTVNGGAVEGNGSSATITSGNNGDVGAGNHSISFEGKTGYFITWTDEEDNQQYDGPHQVGWHSFGSKGFTIRPKDDWAPYGGNLTVTSDNLMSMTVKNKLQAAINSIPGVNVQLDSAVGELSSKSRDCCYDGNIVENGEKYTKGSLSVSCTIKDTTLWGLPSYTRKYSFAGLAEIEIMIEAGVYLTTSIDVMGYTGRRTMQCSPYDECFFAGVSPSVNVSLRATCEAIVCQDTLWTDPDCYGVRVTPASLNVSITGDVRYNSETDCNGLSCSITVAPIEFVADITVNSVGASYRQIIFSGVTIQ